MKIGYSISIGEHVDAEDIDYADISDFKIVCPICREPVHKVERANQHFLSHKHRTPGNDADCELRVASLTRLQLDALDAVSRGQTLEAFFRDLPEMIDMVMPEPQAGVPPWRKIAALNRWRPDARRMRVAHREFMASKVTPELLSYVIDRVMDEERPEHAIRRGGSRLNRHVQRRAAHDMFRTVMTGNGRIGFEPLYWAGWCAAWLQYEMTDGIEAYFAEEAGRSGGVVQGEARGRILAYLSHSIRPKSDFDRVVRRARKDKLWVAPRTGESMSLHAQIGNDVLTAVTRILVGLDYVGAARRRHSATEG